MNHHEQLVHHTHIAYQQTNTPGKRLTSITRVSFVKEILSFGFRLAAAICRQSLSNIDSWLLSNRETNCFSNFNFKKFYLSFVFARNNINSNQLNAIQFAFRLLISILSQVLFFICDIFFFLTFISR